jgi:hypothetical protein
MPSKNPLVRAKALLSGAQRELERAEKPATFDLARSEAERMLDNAIAWLDELIVNEKDGGENDAGDTGEWEYVGKSH